MLTGIEQRAAAEARAATRARRKEVNRARYFRYMRRRYLRFARGVSRTSHSLQRIE
ncbi:MAG: hypothetical protein ACYDAE_23185 [Steroidobacteraceae bacterium]